MGFVNFSQRAVFEAMESASNANKSARVLCRLMYSYNTPDFSSGPVDVEAREMGTKLESPSRMTIQVGKSYIPKSI